MPHHAPMFPDIPVSVASLDCHQYPKGGNTPRNFRVITCSHYCNGGDVFARYVNALHHGRIFHNSFYRLLPTNVLTSIDWRICVEGCHKLVLGQTRFVLHQKECSICNSKQPAQQQQPPMDIRPCDNPNYAPFFTICPTSRRANLELLIVEGATTGSLHATLIGWMIAETQLAAGAHDNA